MEGYRFCLKGTGVREVGDRVTRLGFLGPRNWVVSVQTLGEKKNKTPRGVNLQSEHLVMGENLSKGGGNRYRPRPEKEKKKLESHKPTTCLNSSSMKKKSHKAHPSPRYPPGEDWSGGSAPG